MFQKLTHRKLKRRQSQSKLQPPKTVTVQEQVAELAESFGFRGTGESPGDFRYEKGVNFPWFPRPVNGYSDSLFSNAARSASRNSAIGFLRSFGVI